MTTPTSPLLDVLQEIHLAPKRLQSNYVRDNAQVVARLASCGLITTRVRLHDETFYGHQWRITWQGLRVLELGEPQ